MLKSTMKKGRLFGLVAAIATLALALVLVAGCSSDEAENPSGPEGPEPAVTDNADPSAIDAAAFDALVAAGPVATDDAIAASEWATAVKEAGVLRIGGVQTSTLFSLLNEVDGVTRGFDAGLSQLLANYILGDPTAIEFTQVTSDTRESVLQNDQVDAVFATYSITPARAELISFAGPYYTSQQAILVKAGNTEITCVEDLDGKIVAVQSSSTGPAIMDEYAPGATQQAFATDEEARAALEQGRVDAYVIDVTMQLGAMMKNPGKYNIAGEQFGPVDPYGIGLPLDSDAVAFVNEFLNQIIADGTWEQLWQISLGDRTGVETAPAAPVVGDLSFME